MKTLASGFTLLELMACLLIAAILISIGTPKLFYFFEKQRISAQTFMVWRLLTKTRAMAISSGSRMSICGVDLKNKCSRTDILKFVIYNDTNRNNTFDKNDLSIEYLPLNPNNNIQLKIGGRGKSISYNSTGYARQFGGIIICPQTPDPTLIQKITLNRAGRLYLAPDRDGDGRVESYDGKNINC